MATPAIALAEAESVALSEPLQQRTAELAPSARVRTQPARCDALTANEIRLLEYLASGWTSIQIGRHVCRSEKTIRNQLTCIYSKLGAANRAEAVALFVRRD